MRLREEMGGGQPGAPFFAALSVEGDDIKPYQPVRFKIIKTLKYPLVLALVVCLGIHPTFVFGKDDVKVAILDE